MYGSLQGAVFLMPRMPKATFIKLQQEVALSNV